MKILNCKNLFNDREKQVCELLRKNCALKKIAKELNISLHTVRSHVTKIKRMNSN